MLVAPRRRTQEENSLWERIAAVALGGGAVLAGTTYAAYANVMSQPSSFGGSSDAGSGGSGWGGGGGMRRLQPLTH